MTETPSDTQSPFDSSQLDGPAMREKRDIPDGLWMRCGGCEEMLYRKKVSENMEVCPECGHHFRVGARQRVEMLTDPDSFEEMFADMSCADPLEFKWGGQNYDQYIRDYQKSSGNTEGILTGVAYIRGRRAALGVMDGNFILGSMGSVIGEKITSIVEVATEQHLPLIIVSTSGGARMQEGALSLIQMAKTSAAVARLDDAGGLFISLLADPTMGGTTASFAMLGDVIIAEPGALIGFAGQRVISNTIKADLPEGFQRAEFLLEHGFVDRIVPRHDLRGEIVRLIDYCWHPA